MKDVNINAKLWAAPFWTVETFLNSHTRPARSHAVHHDQLEQQQLMPPVNDKPIGTRGKSKKKRYASKGEEGQNILKKQKKSKNVKTKVSTTKTLVEQSSTYDQVSAGGRWNPVEIGNDDDDLNDELAEVWETITNSKPGGTTTTNKQKREEARCESCSFPYLAGETACSVCGSSSNTNSKHSGL